MSTTPPNAEGHYLPSRRQLFRLPRRYPLPYGWGMASLCLGFIGLALCIFPVLGVPISACALFCGIVGFVVSLPRSGITLRWSFMGLALSGSALAINVAITYAIAGYVPGRNVEPPWQPPEERPYVSPPSSETVVPEIGVKVPRQAEQARPG